MSIEDSALEQMIVELGPELEAAMPLLSRIFAAITKKRQPQPPQLAAEVAPLALRAEQLWRQSFHHAIHDGYKPQQAAEFADECEDLWADRFADGCAFRRIPKSPVQRGGLSSVPTPLAAPYGSPHEPNGEH